MNSVIIPMAGTGSRFRNAGYTVHKPLIKVGGKTLLKHSIDSLGLTSWNLILVARDLGGSYRSDLEKLVPHAKIVWINELTSGATETAFKAADYIDPDGELIITNCDQYLDWMSNKFLESCQGFDGAVLTYKSSDPKNSFVLKNGTKVLDIVEKKAVSQDALVGLHWWRKASDFMRSAQAQIKDFDGSKETFVSETYSYLLREGRQIGAFEIIGKYWSLGTPDDLNIFKGYVSEYETPKPKTLFIDLDGTILKHGHRYSDLKQGQELCPNVLDSLNEADSMGDKIILVSARKESARAITEALLQDLGVPYDQLILGVTQGRRIVVNDVASASSPHRASALNVICDSGFKYEDL